MNLFYALISTLFTGGRFFQYLVVVLIVWFIYTKRKAIVTQSVINSQITKRQRLLALFIFVFWVIPFLVFQFFQRAQYNSGGFSSPEFGYIVLTMPFYFVGAYAFLVWLIWQTLLSIKQPVNNTLIFPRRLIVIILWVLITFSTGYYYYQQQHRESKQKQDSINAVLRDTPGTQEYSKWQQEKEDYIKSQAIDKAQNYSYPILLPKSTKSIYTDHYNNFVFEFDDFPGIYVLEVGIPNSKAPLFSPDKNICDVHYIEYGKVNQNKNENYIMDETCTYIGKKGVLDLYKRKYNYRASNISKREITQIVGRYGKTAVSFCASPGYCDNANNNDINRSINAAASLKVGSNSELIDLINSSKFKGKSEQ